MYLSTFHAVILPSKPENHLKELPNNINDIPRTLQIFEVGKQLFFTDNFKITSNDLWKVGTHLVRNGEILSASSFINNLNYLFPNTEVQDPAMQAS